MLRKIVLWLLAFFLSISSAACEPSPLLTENKISVFLVQAECQDGRVQIRLSCRNDSVQKRNLILLDPLINGATANFISGWGSEEIDLKAGETREAEIVLLTEDPDQAIESASLRFFCEGYISSPCVLTFSSEGCMAVPASFAEGSDEPPLLDEILENAAGSVGQILLTDTLQPQETAHFDYGKAILCIHIKNEDGDYYMPFCAVSVTVDQNGCVQALYSGMAITLSSDTLFPLYVEESNVKDTSYLEASGIVLTGDPIFFAELSFQVSEENGETRLLSSKVESPELHGECVNCPRVLFSEMSAYHSYITFLNGEGRVEIQESFGQSIVLPLDQALAVTVRPATDLGEICVYYEYYYTDGSVIFRMPYKVA